MRSPRFALAVALVAAAPAVRAQSPLSSGRAVVPTPVVLGMGDASVAFPSTGSAFQYNPAHLYATSGFMPSFTVFGAQLRGSSGLRDQLAFVQDEVRPAVRRGLDSLSEAERDTLYRRALGLTRPRTFGHVEVRPVAGSMRIGAFAVGAGLFATAATRYRAIENGEAAPLVDGAVVSDLTALGSVALNLGPAGLSPVTLGATLRATNRRLVVKEKPLDAFEASETLYVQSAAATSVDAGVLVDVPLPIPGRVLAGASALDVLSTGYDFDYRGRRLCGSGSFVCPNSREAPPAALVAAEDSLATRRFALRPSYRVGVAYQLPTTGGLLAGSGVSVDYLRTPDPLVEGAPSSSLNVGAQVQLFRRLAVRVGWSGDALSAGAGLRLGAFALDYATYGVAEETSVPAPTPRQHLLSVGLQF